MEFKVEQYTPQHKNAWDDFIRNAKNATFLFYRDYMDYHSDRFQDCSLMVYKKNKLYALLPANKTDNVLYSHQGLTYGGLLMLDKATTADILEVFREMNDFLKSIGVSDVIYKVTPYIYHKIPSQEDLYALFRLTDAHIIARNISSTIYQDNKLRFIELRRRGIKRALLNNITVSDSDDYSSFWNILSQNLKNKYGVLPVHSLQEINLLRSRFPENIKLYMAFNKEHTAIAGTVLYLTETVVHTQYISASREGKENGALDLLYDYLINGEYKDYPIWDFGQSTEDMGHILNESLIFQKEGFGGRGVCYDIYEYSL